MSFPTEPLELPQRVNRRAKVEVISDILHSINRAGESGISPTHIMQESNLSWVLTRDILLRLSTTYYITVTHCKNNDRYNLTSKGTNLLNLCNLLDNTITELFPERNLRR